MSYNCNFEDLGLSSQTLKAVYQKGFEEPTNIQKLTIPPMLKNDNNIVTQAQTGTGKTAAFGLPLIDMVDPDFHSVQALIVTPTRELAIQVSEEINSLKGDKNIVIVPIYGGQSIDQQFRRLKKGVHIIAGTPGRIIDHLNRKTLKLKDIKHLILDEADEMLNMGFIEEVEEILKHTNPDKRILLFSATIPKKIRELAHKYMNGYKLITDKKKQLTTNLTEQIYFEVKTSDKFEVLCRIIDMEDGFYGIIFCRTKNDVDSVVSHLSSRGYDAEAIHGDITQIQRERTLKKFRTKSINVLVATDVAARGIDVANLTHVINYSLPHDPESYVHRIGRTGRAGNEGTAITFITPREYKRLMFIQRIAKTDIRKGNIPRVKDIIKAKRKKINEELANLMAGDIDDQYYRWAKHLLAETNPTQLLAVLLNYCFKQEIDPEGYGEISQSRKKNFPLDLQGKARLFIALGKKDKMNAAKLVKLIVSKVAIEPKQISDIQVMNKFSFVTVPFEEAEKIVYRFKQKGQKPLVSHARNLIGKSE